MEMSNVGDPGLSEVYETFLEALRCVGGNLGVVYVTVPITSGRRYFRLQQRLREGQITEDDFGSLQLDEVVIPNCSDAESWAEQARNSFRGRVVLDPSRLHRDGWSQNDYNALWSRVIDGFVDTLVATPNWAFSRGAHLEIQTGLTTNRRIADLNGGPYSHADLADDVVRARDELVSWGWSIQEAEQAIPELSLPSGDLDRFEIELGAWRDAFGWVHDDVNEYTRERAVYTRESDDERTSRGLTAADGWIDRLERYLSAAIDHGPSSNQGRVELGSLVGVSVGMLRSIWRIHGPLTPHDELSRPGWEQRVLHPLSVDPRRSEQHFAEIDSAVWTWVQQERQAMRPGYPTADDDMWTVELDSGDPHAWQSELRRHWSWAVQEGLDSQRGKNSAGKSVVVAFRLFESAVRLYGRPRRQLRDISRGLNHL